jgi:hypothetical protein
MAVRHLKQAEITTSLQLGEITLGLLSGRIAKDVANGDTGERGSLDLEKLWGWVDAISDYKELNSDGTVRTITYTNTVNTPYITGDAYNGGIIFYINGLDVLIVAENDLTTQYPWTPSSDPFPYTSVGGTSPIVNSGQANTTAIVSALGAGDYAAKACDDLTLNTYSDWYLPSLFELTRVYSANGVLNLPVATRWTSTEGAPSKATIASSQTPPSTGYGSGDQDKATLFSVRPIRKDTISLNTVTSTVSTVTNTDNIVSDWQNDLSEEKAWDVVEKINRMARKVLPPLVFNKVLQNKLKLI